MTINNEIARLEAVVAHLNGLEARVKAVRMQTQTVLDQRKRDRQILIDRAYELMDQPTPEDIHEFDKQRFDGPTPAEAFHDHINQVEFDIEQGAEQ